MLLLNPAAAWRVLPFALWWERFRAVLAGPGPLPPGARDNRIDMFRGLALLTIFVNHVPGTVYEGWTSRNFGFSDAAEAFVFLSGLATALAYSDRLRPGSMWRGTARIWARVRQIYFVHIVVTLIVLAVFATVSMWLDKPQLLGMHNIPQLFQHPLEAMIGLPLLTYQIGYVNILSTYVVLMLVSPLLILAAKRQPLALVAASVALWAAAAQFQLNFPNYPGGGGWFLNPLSWQLIFVVGLCCGVGMRQGKDFVPYNPILFWAALAFVAFVLLWVRIPELGEAGRNGLGWLFGLGVPGYLLWFDKVYLFLPRLLHALALFYVLANIGLIGWFASTRAAEPLRVLGRHSLAVFGVGTVLSLTLQALRKDLPPNPLGDGLMLAGGIGLLLCLAQALDYLKRNNSRPAKDAVDALPSSA